MPSTPARELPGPRPENTRRRRELQGPRRALIGLLGMAAALAVFLGATLIVLPNAQLFRERFDVLFASPLSETRATGATLIAIGAVQAWAALTLVQHQVRARLIALVAALIVVAWSLLQMMVSNGVTWFQICAFGVGALEAFLVAGCTPRKPAKIKHQPGRR
jgi:hypothetical protein